MAKTQTIKNKIKEMKQLIEENIIDPVISTKLERLRNQIDNHCRVERSLKNMSTEEYLDIMEETRW